MEPSTRLKDPLIEQFNSLVKPNDIKIESFKLFLTELPYEKFGLFPFFRMTAQQNIYSSKDLIILAKTTGSVTYRLHRILRKCFEKRVSADLKEAGFIAEVRIYNIEQLMRNFIYEPAVLSLRGSKFDDYDFDDGMEDDTSHD